MNAKPNRAHEQIFMAITSIRQLNELSADTNTGNGLLFNDLVQLGVGNSATDTKKVLSAINASARWQNEYIKLLEQLSIADSGQQAAANTTNSFACRKNEQFELLFKPDPIDADQVFVILKLEMQLLHTRRGNIQLHCVLDKLVSIIDFPPLQQGSTQKLFDFNDNEYTLLNNINTQIFIM